jgi:hypothetical protein
MDERSIRRTLTAMAEATSPSEELWHRIERRIQEGNPPRTPIRRASIVILALLVGGASFALLTRAFRQPPPDEQPGTMVQELEIDRPVGRILIAAGSVWISSDGDVIRLAPSDGQVRATIPVRIEEGGRYGSVGEVNPRSGLTFGDDLVWVTAEPFFVGIDPATNEVATSIALESGVTHIDWVDGRLLYGGSGEGLGRTGLLEPLSFDVDDVGIGAGPNARVMATEHWYWSGGEGLSRASIDGAQRQEFRSIGRVDSMAQAGDSVWVTNGDVLWRIDAGYEAPPAPTYTHTDDAVVDAIQIAGPGLVAGDGEHLWLLERIGSDESRLSQIDPATGRPLGEALVLRRGGASDMFVADGLPWVAFGADGALVTVRPKT